MSLKPQQKRFLRSLCHSLKPVILMGAKGLTESLTQELEGALAHHELVKIKLATEDREARKALITNLAEKTHAEVVQAIGKTVCLYRPHADKVKIVLPR